MKQAEIDEGEVVVDAGLRFEGLDCHHGCIGSLWAWCIRRGICTCLAYKPDGNRGLE